MCMEHLWQDRLMAHGWSLQAAWNVTACRAKSTWDPYNKSMMKFLVFLRDKHCDLGSMDEAVIADCVCHLGASSSCPMSLLSTFSAAFSSLLEVLNMNNQLSQDIWKLLQGTQKQHTFSPLQRTSVMPITPFARLFKLWSASKMSLPLAKLCLCLKALTLYALTTILRPLDIAPRSGHVFRRSAISSDEEGGLVIYFHGTKNDADHDGFRIVLRPSSDPEMCPVSTLLHYMTQTAVQAKGAVFVSLQAPYTLLSAPSVAQELNRTIDLAGLDCHLQCQELSTDWHLDGCPAGSEPCSGASLGQVETGRYIFETLCAQCPSH